LRKKITKFFSEKSSDAYDSPGISFLDSVLVNESQRTLIITDDRPHRIDLIDSALGGLSRLATRD